MERLRPRVRILRKSLILYFLQQTTVSHQTHLFPRPILGHSARAVNSEGKVFEYNSHTSPIVFIGDIQNADLALFFVVFVLSEEKCLRMNSEHVYSHMNCKLISKAARLIDADVRRGW